MYCPNCGKETDGKFCQFCGAPLPQAEEQPAPAKRKPWLPIAVVVGVAAIVTGVLVFLRGKLMQAPAEPEPEPTPEATEEPLPDSYIEGVSVEAYWKGIEAVNGFGEQYWKDAAAEIGDIYIELDSKVDDPTHECMFNMASVFKNAEFVKTARQSINAITNDTEGPDYEWERYIAISWLMKAEGTISKLVNGEESAVRFTGLKQLTKLTQSELKMGNDFIVLIAASALTDNENQQEVCESISQWLGESKTLEILEVGLECRDWLESTKSA